MIMESAKNVRWIIPFKKFDMVRDNGISHYFQEKLKFKRKLKVKINIIDQKYTCVMVLFCFQIGIKYASTEIYIILVISPKLSVLTLTLILPEPKVISICHQYKARSACTVWPDSILLAEILHDKNKDSARLFVVDTFMQRLYQ